MEYYFTEDNKRYNYNRKLYQRMDAYYIELQKRRKSPRAFLRRICEFESSIEVKTHKRLLVWDKRHPLIGWILFVVLLKEVILIILEIISEGIR